MYRVTQKWKVIDINTYGDVKHMRNILHKYGSYDPDNAYNKYSLPELREAVNNYISKFIRSIPDQIITPITHCDEWLEIIIKKFWPGYKDEWPRLRESDYSYWFYKDGKRSVTTHNDYKWYTLVTPREFLMKVLHEKDESTTKIRQFDGTYDVSMQMCKQYWKCNNSRGLTEWHAISLTPFQKTTMTTLSQTINEAYFADNKLAIKAAEAVDILQWEISNLDKLNAFIGKLHSRLSNIKWDINKSFEQKDKDRFVEALDKHNTLLKFLKEDNIWWEVLDLAEEFTEAPTEFDPEEYLNR